jgi:uncharacterized protein YabE (DUF348 family)
MNVKILDILLKVREISPEALEKWGMVVLTAGAFLVVLFIAIGVLTKLIKKITRKCPAKK